MSNDQARHQPNLSHLASLGTVGTRVELVPYSSEWPVLFARESARIREACGSSILTIEHIGSTAVPSLRAKPVLDLMPGLAKIDDAEMCIKPMEQLGYRHLGEYGIPERAFFTLDVDGRRVVHVHMFILNSEHWHRHLVFRDTLRRDRKQREAYASLKQTLAAKFGDDRDGYADAKSEFINSAVRAAQRRGTIEHQKSAISQ